MPPRKKKIRTPDGREVDAIQVGFQAGAEHWNEYFVDDGTVLRIKLVATEILKLEGEYDENGEPRYVLASQNIMTISAPENLRKEGG